MTLVAIGGAEDKQGGKTVLKKVLDLARGAGSKVHVITSATAYPEDAEKTYRAVFASLGADCEVSHVTTPAQADDPALVARVAQADVIFFSGGDQSRLAQALDGTALLQTVIDRHNAGAVVAGTSAGAAAMSQVMITGGDPGRAHMEGEITSSAGLSLAPHIIFDTHFLNRGRLPRLFNLVSRNPERTGLGLDEDTAAVLRADGTVEVVGSGMVTVVTQGAASGLPETVTLRQGDTHRLR